MSSQKQTAEVGEANIYYSGESSSSSEEVLSYLAIMERYGKEKLKNDNNSNNESSSEEFATRSEPH